MTATATRGRTRARALGLLALGFAAALLVGEIAPATAEPGDQPIVLAQAEQQPRGFNPFRFLLRPFRRAQPQEPQYVPERAAPRQGAAVQPRPKRARKTAPAPAEPVVVAVEKAGDAKRVLVVGDFMATALAKGLTDAYAQNANIVVIDKSNGDSGLVRQDHFNWAAELHGLVESEKPDAVLALVGTNDRQPIDTESGAYVLGSDGWRTAYAARVAAFADALKATGKPAFWVGIPPVRRTTNARDYSSFNGMVRDQLDEKGLRFIDVWNGFADEDGQFVSAGPDVGGQNAQLRTGDGLNFTKAGQRKLAFFVEQELDNVFGTAPAVAATGVTAPAAAGQAQEGPKIGPMVSLDALAADGASTLSAGASPESIGSATAAVVKRLSGAGGSAPIGRADSYGWPGAAP
jgi:hypothetical protein